MHHEDKVEEAEVDKYLSFADVEEPKAEDKKSYLKARYEQIKQEYKNLQLNKLEAEGRRDERMVRNLRDAFADNYRARRWVVLALRSAGEKCEDPFIPNVAS